MYVYYALSSQLIDHLNLNKPSEHIIIIMINNQSLLVSVLVLALASQISSLIIIRDEYLLDSQISQIRSGLFNTTNNIISVISNMCSRSQESSIFFNKDLFNNNLR